MNMRYKISLSHDKKYFHPFHIHRAADPDLHPLQNRTNKLDVRFTIDSNLIVVVAAAGVVVTTAATVPTVVLLVIAVVVVVVVVVFVIGVMVVIVVIVVDTGYNVRLHIV